MLPGQSPEFPGWEGPGFSWLQRSSRLSGYVFVVTFWLQSCSSQQTESRFVYHVEANNDLKFQQMLQYETKQRLPIQNTFCTVRTRMTTKGRPGMFNPEHGVEFQVPEFPASRKVYTSRALSFQLRK